MRLGDRVIIPSETFVEFQYGTEHIGEDGAGLS